MSCLATDRNYHNRDYSYCTLGGLRVSVPFTKRPGTADTRSAAPTPDDIWDDIFGRTYSL